jgi:hypothetical protein
MSEPLTYQELVDMIRDATGGWASARWTAKQIATRGVHPLTCDKPRDKGDTIDTTPQPTAQPSA